MKSDPIVIVGAGFSGLGMGIRLKQAGIDDFVILEKAGGVGGTWRDNHYPGAACDVESHLYSFSFEPNPGWSRTFAGQREILAYLEHCADKYGLRPHLRFDTAVTGATFDERAGTWTVKTSRGDRLPARVLVSAIGGFNLPSYPDIPGLDTFGGKVVHSARWDDSYPLEGKRVGVVGTGASAIQIVPAIAPRVGRLHVFQRTPPWIVPKLDHPISEQERERFRRWPALQRLERARQYWLRELVAVGFVKSPAVLRLASKLALRYLRASVRDRALRDKLTPSYTMGCKRILPSNDYYPALTRENVELVTEGIQEVRPRGIVTRDGQLRELDAIVCATGFTVADFLLPFSMKGRGGRDLNEAWRGGAEAHLGSTVSGFPNFFIVFGPNTGLGHNSMIFMIESQIDYAMSAIRLLKKERLRYLDVRADAQARYNESLQARLAKTVWSTGCTSWYLNKDGKNTTLWPGFTVEFYLRTRRLDPRDYELVAEDAASVARDPAGAPVVDGPGHRPGLRADEPPYAPDPS
jgi:cation diffusion facilitator CzcD-associated flavoprotein CzcO